VTSAFDRAVGGVRPLDAAAAAEAVVHHDRLSKPRGALGRLELLGIHLAGIAGVCPPPVPAPAAVTVFAGDHGVVAEGVTPWPREVTAQMVANFVTEGAAINVLARQMGATVTVVDVGVATPLPAACLDAPGLLHRRVRPGTGNIALGPAMTMAECRTALDVGAEVAAETVLAGAKALVTGEMGIGNTTVAAAVIAALSGRPAASVTGRGTGVNPAVLARKVSVVERALARHASAISEGPLAVLASLGGFEVAALTGYVVGGAAAGVPVIVDGVIADAALLVAERVVPGVARRCILGHRSVEPGASAVFETLGMAPLLDLGMRLGEGTGACLALPVVEAAARIMIEMATFDEAGVTNKDG
jgi:nicotinate-nucleotide--dimethylbenzimidazole phosphoribosyltransferase